ncbi:MAG: ECF transporter S component [Actinomycetota bacterium]
MSVRIAPVAADRRERHPVPIRVRSAVVLGIATVAGLAMFLWPLLVSPSAQGTAHANEAPFLFVLILPVVIAVVLFELADDGIDVKALAVLGLLAGVGAVLRPLGAGTAGIETVFFLLILAGRVYGPGFGFVLGATTLFASAIVTGGVGPWLPFQMMAAAWIGLGAGLLPRCTGKAEIALLAAYGVIAAYAFGFLMNMWFWPFAVGTFTGVPDSATVQFVPGDAVVENLRRFFVFTVTTSTLGWDTGRAITTATAVALIGAPVLAALRRARKKARFES